MVRWMVAQAKMEEGDPEPKRKKVGVHVSTERHKALRRKLLDDELSLTAFFNGAISAYLSDSK